MNEFFENKEVNNNQQEYKYKILVWPNITKKDLSKDSYIQVLKNIIPVVNKINPSIFWTIPTTEILKELKFPNTEQIIINLPSEPNMMRLHFNTSKIEEIVNHRNQDFDIIYSHLPEHTNQLANLVFNHTGLRPKIIGYCHWYELKENTQNDKTMFLQNIIGTLEMLECGVNSIWLKNKVLNESKKYFNISIIEKLNNIIQPHYLPSTTLTNNNNETLPQIPNSILFNHRANQYTGWTTFLSLMDSLWTKRQDFTVYMTWDCNDSKPYLKKVNLNKSEYHNLIKKMTVGVGLFKSYSAWSLSVMDGFSFNLPYLLPNSLCYPEMVGNDYPLFYNSYDGFLSKLNSILDLNNNNDFKSKYKPYLDTIVNNFTPENTVAKWFNNWNVFNDFKIINNSAVYENIVGFIKSKKFVSKYDLVSFLSWGVHIGYGYYRNMLRNDPRIQLTKFGYLYR